MVWPPDGGHPINEDLAKEYGMSEMEESWGASLYEILKELFPERRGSRIYVQYLRAYFRSGSVL